MYIVSFYSYKGGVGRTVSLLNTAWTLAERGRKVALLDLDLEAPGLSSAPLWKNEKGEWTKPTLKKGFCELVNRFMKEHSFPTDWVVDHLLENLGPDSNISLISAENNYYNDAEYIQFIQQFSWFEFYEHESGKTFMESLVDGIKQEGFDYLFIDARTGLTDVAGITLLHLPDLAVLFTNLSRQSSAGIHRQLQTIEQLNELCGNGQSNLFRRNGAENQPVEVLLVGSPLIRGEWLERQKRIHEIEEEFGRPLDVQVDHLPFLSTHENHQILAQHRPNHSERGSTSGAGDLLSGASEPFARLADEISRRNPMAPENFIVDARQLLEVGLWRPSVAHFGEAVTRMLKDGQITPTNTNNLKVSLEKIRAQHFGLSPWEDKKELLNLEKKWLPEIDNLRQLGIDEISKNNSEVFFEFGRSWLAIAFPFMLINETAQVEESTGKALRYLKKLANLDKDNQKIQDLLALTLVQHGDALVLNGKWEEALNVTKEAIDIYKKLQARLLLLGLSLTQAVQIGVKLERMNSVCAWIKRAEIAKNQLDNNHLEANFRHANALILYEKGKGVSALQEMNRALESFKEDNDDVGAVNVVVTMTAMGWSFPSMPQETEAKGGHPVSRWMKMAEEQLRMPVAARRMVLAYCGSAILRVRSSGGYTRPDIFLLADIFRIGFTKSYGLSFFNKLSTGSNRVWVQELLGNFQEDSNRPERVIKNKKYQMEVAEKQDSAFLALVWLEGCRYLLIKNSNLIKLDKDYNALDGAGLLLEAVRTKMEREQQQQTDNAEGSKVCAVRVEATHQFLLLDCLLAFAKEDQSALEIHRTLLDKRISNLEEMPLKRLHVLIVLAMVNVAVEGNGSKKQQKSDPLAEAEKILRDFEQPNKWPWDFPLMFLRHTKIDRLSNAWKRIETRLQPYLPDNGVYNAP